MRRYWDRSLNINSRCSQRYNLQFWELGHLRRWRTSPQHYSIYIIPTLAPTVSTTITSTRIRRLQLQTCHPRPPTRTSFSRYSGRNSSLILGQRFWRISSIRWFWGILHLGVGWSRCVCGVFFLDVIRLFDRYYKLRLGCRFLFLLNQIDTGVALCNNLYRATQARQERSLGITSWDRVVSLSVSIVIYPSLCTLRGFGHRNFLPGQFNVLQAKVIEIEIENREECSTQDSCLS